MRCTLAWATAVTSLLALVAGCEHRSSTPTETTDPLEWVERGIEHKGLAIALGYRRGRESVERSFEPVASITRDGKPVADAMVFCRLLSADGRVTLRDEVATVYEPSVGRDPALYAQGRLPAPEGASPCVVRFRVILSDVDQEWTRDMQVP